MLLMPHCSLQILDVMNQEYQCGCHGGMHATTHALLIKESKLSVGGSVTKQDGKNVVF